MARAIERAPAGEILAGKLGTDMREIGRRPGRQRRIDTAFEPLAMEIDGAPAGLDLVEPEPRLHVGNGEGIAPFARPTHDLRRQAVDARRCRLEVETGPAGELHALGFHR